MAEVEFADAGGVEADDVLERDHGVVGAAIHPVDVEAERDGGRVGGGEHVVEFAGGGLHLGRVGVVEEFGTAGAQGAAEGLKGF